MQQEWRTSFPLLRLSRGCRGVEGVVESDRAAERRGRAPALSAFRRRSPWQVPPLAPFVARTWARRQLGPAFIASRWAVEVAWGPGGAVASLVNLDGLPGRKQNKSQYSLRFSPLFAQRNSSSTGVKAQNDQNVQAKFEFPDF